MESFEKNKLSMQPIGCMKTCFSTKNGTPRQPTVSPTSRGKLKISKSIFTNPEHSLIGLNEFSHIWILFYFHLNETKKSAKAKVKPPRMNGSKTGVFSTRSPHRPNPIGLTLAKLESVEDDVITVSGVDIVDETPILDIKPYIPTYDSVDSRSEMKPECDNSHPYEAQTAIADWVGMKSTLKVVFTKRASEQLQQLRHAAENEPFCLNIEKSIAEILCEDPRSVYRKTKCEDRLYYFSINNIHVTVWFDESTSPTTAEVLRIRLSC